MHPTPPSRLLARPGWPAFRHRGTPVRTSPLPGSFSRLVPAAGSARSLLDEKWVGAGVAAGGGDLQAREEVVPALAVLYRGLLRGQIDVEQVHDGPVAIGRQGDLDPRGARRNTVIAFPTPGEHHALGRDDLDVLAHRDLEVVDAHAVLAARTRIELRRAALPADHLLRVREELEDGRGLRLDADRHVDQMRHVRPFLLLFFLAGFTRARVLVAHTSRSTASFSRWRSPAHISRSQASSSARPSGR